MENAESESRGIQIFYNHFLAIMNTTIARAKSTTLEQRQTQPVLLVADNEMLVDLLIPSSLLRLSSSAKVVQEQEKAAVAVGDLVDGAQQPAEHEKQQSGEHKQKRKQKHKHKRKDVDTSTLPQAGVTVAFLGVGDFVSSIAAGLLTRQQQSRTPVDADNRILMLVQSEDFLAQGVFERWHVMQRFGLKSSTKWEDVEWKHFEAAWADKTADCRWNDCCKIQGTAMDLWRGPDRHQEAFNAALQRARLSEHYCQVCDCLGKGNLWFPL